MIDAQAEVPPKSVGMTKRGVKSIWRATERFYRGGTQPAISVCIRKHGEIVLKRSIGHASGNAPSDDRSAPKVVATPDTPFCIFSASKAVTAMCMHLLEQRGELYLDDRVTDYIPEYGRNGKEWTTIRHVLTHRAGVPSVPREHNNIELLGEHDKVLQLLCEAKPVNVPGRRLAYHAITGGFILGEIVKRVTGDDLRVFFDREFKTPLGMKYMNYGIEESRINEVAQNAFAGPDVALPLRPLVKRALGVSLREAVQVSNEAGYLTPIVPSGNIVATADDLSKFYQLLVAGGSWNGVDIFEPKTIRRALVESAYLELDLTLFAPVHYCQGLMLGADRFSLYGPDTPEAYGHLGFIEVLGWADPQRDTSVAILTSGKPFFGAHLLKLWGLLKAISKHTA